MPGTDRHELPPAFPPWMRAADPVLACEETNGLFQAFRRRRARLERSVLFLPDLRLATMTGLLVVWANLGKQVGMAACVILAVLVFARTLLNHQRARRRERMPLRLGEFFSSDGPRRLAGDIGRDLWLLPSTGADVAEALYLELREMSCRILVRSTAVDSAWLAAVWLGVARPAPAELWREVIPITLLILAWRKMVKLYLTRLEPGQCWRSIRLELDRWQAVLEGTGAEAVEHFLRTTQWLVVITVAAGLCGVISLACAINLPNPLGKGGLLYGDQRPMTLGLLLILVYAVLISIELWTSPEPGNQASEVLPLADARYTRYMRKATLIHD